jgi:hypothetical protein
MARIQRAIDMLEQNPVDSLRNIKYDQQYFQDEEDFD